MFKYAGPGIEIFCDITKRALRVRTNSPLPNGLKSFPTEVASFTSSDEWSKSPYFSQVTDEDTLDTICWFWIDLDDTTPAIQNP